MNEAAQELTRLSSSSSLDEDAVIIQADLVMTLEKDLKLGQLGLLVKIKNLLSPEQQEQLQELRRQGQGGSGVGQTRRLNNPNIRN